MSDVLKLLIQSIQSRQCAIIRYDGQQSIRVVEPHVIYTHSSGNIIVECLQTRGHSGPDTRFPFWQGFYLKKINSVFLLDIHFEARIKQGFKPDRADFRRGYWPWSPPAPCPGAANAQTSRSIQCLIPRATGCAGSAIFWAKSCPTKKALGVNNAD